MPDWRAAIIQRSQQPREPSPDFGDAAPRKRTRAAPQYARYPRIPNSPGFIANVVMLHIRYGVLPLSSRRIVIPRSCSSRCRRHAVPPTGVQITVSPRPVVRVRTQAGGLLLTLSSEQHTRRGLVIVYRS